VHWAGTGHPLFVKRALLQTNVRLASTKRESVVEKKRTHCHVEIVTHVVQENIKAQRAKGQQTPVAKAVPMESL